MTDFVQHKVHFDSGETRLSGHLFLPPHPAPGVIVAGSWITVKEQMADLYARALASAGFAVLTFDFAHFGESEGEPRQQESPAAKIRDIIAASQWLANRDEVSGSTVGGLAICASAGYLAYAVEQGAPISAMVTVAAWLHDAGTVGEMYGGEEGVAERMRDGAAAAAAYALHGEVLYVPAYSDEDPKAAMGAMVKPYYGNPSRGAVPQWDNRFAVLSWSEWLTFDALRPAPSISVPTLMVHSDEAAFPGNVRRFAESLGGPNEIIWIDGTQLDFYDQPVQSGAAAKAAVDHFRSTLSKARGATMPDHITADQAQARTIVAAMTALVDLRDWERLGRCFADTLVVDYTSLWGGEAQQVTRAALLEQWKGLLPGFDATQHELGSAQVSVDGERAQVIAPISGTHLCSGQAWIVEGHYHCSLIRQSGTWCINGLTYVHGTEKGDRAITETAMQRARQQS